MQDRRDIVNNSSINVVSQYGGMNLPAEVLSLAIPFAFLIGTKAVEEKKGSKKMSNDSKETKSKKKSSKTSKKSKTQGGAGYSSNPSYSSYSSHSSSPGNLLMPNSIVNQAYEMAKSINLPNTKL